LWAQLEVGRRQIEEVRHRPPHQGRADPVGRQGPRRGSLQVAGPRDGKAGAAKLRVGGAEPLPRAGAAEPLPPFPNPRWARHFALLDQYQESEEAGSLAAPAP